MAKKRLGKKERALLKLARANNPNVRPYVVTAEPTRQVWDVAKPRLTKDIPIAQSRVTVTRTGDWILSKPRATNVSCAAPERLRDPVRLISMGLARHNRLEAHGNRGRKAS